MSVASAAPLHLPGSLRWLQRPPLTIADGCAGHVVVVVLWRLGCVHSCEALADAARLVAEVGERAFAVLAVQVPTCAAERDAARQQRAIAGLPCAHAVDERRELARAVGALALPFVLLLDVDGSIVFRGAGVPHRVRLAGAVDTLLAAAAHDGRQATVPFAPTASVPTVGDGGPPLAPRGLHHDGERLWLASAGHRRVYALSPGGAVVATFGSGVRGQTDGGADVARFDAPTAVLPLGERVLVADAGAHTLRAIEPASGDVSTWSGTGRRSTDRTGGAYARDQGLCTPVALGLRDGAVVIAMAAAHQLWQFDPATRAAAAWLGSGERTARHAGDVVFVEPRGFAIVGDTLLVADAGVDAVVAVDLAHQRAAVRWANVPRASSVLVHRDRVFVAASWGPAVLVADAGDATAPLSPFLDAAHGLVEPVALTAHGDTLWIADVGADAVFVVDLAAVLQPQPLPRLPLVGVAPLPPGASAGARLSAPLRLREHSDVVLRLTLPAPLAAAGTRWTIDVVDEAEPRLAVPRHAVAVAAGGVVEVLLPVGEAGHGALRLRAACDTAVLRTVLPVEVAVDGALRVDVS